MKVQLTPLEKVKRHELLVKEARAWSRATRKDLLFRLASLNLKEKNSLLEDAAYKPLNKSIKTSVRKYEGELDRIGFSFLRKGIFLERGVGRGRPVNSAKANANAKPWLEPTLDAALEDLVVLLSERYADIIVADLRFLIPGIMDTKIKGGKLPDFVTSSVDGDDVKILIDPAFF